MWSVENQVEQTFNEDIHQKEAISLFCNNNNKNNDDDNDSKK